MRRGDIAAALAAQGWSTERGVFVGEHDIDVLAQRTWHNETRGLNIHIRLFIHRHDSPTPYEEELPHDLGDSLLRYWFGEDDLPLRRAIAKVAGNDVVATLHRLAYPGQRSLFFDDLPLAPHAPVRASAIDIPTLPNSFECARASQQAELARDLESLADDLDAGADPPETLRSLIATASLVVPVVIAPLDVPWLRVERHSATDAERLRADVVAPDGLSIYAETITRHFDRMLHRRRYRPAVI
ncbi:MAG TPA: hypothetical protein VGF69_15465 [Thermoanaerobaculia bacterium]